MKRLLFSLLIFAMCMAVPPSVEAQSKNDFQKFVFTDLDTSFINTTPEYSTYTFAKPKDYLMITATVTKRSGTVAGSVKLYGSFDDTVYTLMHATSDSMLLTNVTTAQSKTWTFGPTTPKYKYVKGYFQGQGTMNAYYFIRAQGYDD